MATLRNGPTAWTLGCLLLVAGLLALAAGRPMEGGAAALAGGLVLAWRGALHAHARAREAGVPPPGGAAPFLAATLLGGLALALALLAPWLPAPARVVAGALGAQTFLLALGHDPTPQRSRVRRHAMPLVGHAAVLAGSGLVLASGDPFAAASGLTYAAGFAVLLLHAHWTQRLCATGEERARVDGWETLLLGLLVVGVGSMTVVYAAQTALPGLVPLVEAPALAAALAAGAAAIALLCAPPPAPGILRARTGTLLDVFAHGAAAIALLNVLFLGVSLVSGWSLKLIFATLFSWQLVVIGMEYRTLRHAERRRRRLTGTTPDIAPPEPITVIIPAANEADVLPVSLGHNLAVDYPLRFILVPAIKSTDRTVEMAQEYAARHPDRVRVVLGDSGSKAEDLNKAWKLVDTPNVLLLDADETIDAQSIRRGLSVLRARPEVGVVQGRKVSRAPEDGWLARFISAERRYCTWMDHVMHGEDLGSSHFGGSAALLRREVPPALGGWTDRTMTEDIEFTLRLHLDDRWKIAYHPEMVVREADPVSFQELLRQRTRWARGWAQCFALYLPDVVASRRRLGGRRAFGLVWLLLIAISALWTTFVPAMLLMRLAGISPLLPLVVAFPLTLILLPSRLLAYGYAAFRDPVIPARATPGRMAELALQAYVWILVGWFVQLHALYLELSSAPRVWYVTGKRGRRAAPEAG